jgi:hypothetical protein
MKTGCRRRILPPIFLLTLSLAAELFTSRAYAVDITTANSGIWTNPAAWSPSQVPGLNDNVNIAAGHTNTIPDNIPHAVGNLTILGGGVLTHGSNTTTAAGERFKAILAVSGNLIIEAGGQINADGKGYTGDHGPGRPMIPNKRTGGSHGGRAAIDEAPPGPTYGSIIAPTNLGSGGYSVGSGGAIQLAVAGTTTVFGTISAVGNVNARGGSGGSIFLTTGFLTGTGTLTVAGGKGSGNRGGGGGGRLAVILTNSLEFGSVNLIAYAGISPGAGQQGAGGTVYLQHTNHAAGQGKLIVDYGDIPPIPSVPSSSAGGYNARAHCVTVQNELEPSSYTFSEIILTNGGVYALDTNDTLAISSIDVIKGDPSDKFDGLYVGGALTVATPFSSYSNFFIGISEPTAAFSPSPLLTVKSNEILRVNAPFALNCPLTVEPFGVVDHAANVTAEVYKLDLAVNGDLTVHSNGMITADDAGYVATFGPGKGLSSGTLGASHGGLGGLRYAYQTNGPTYGSIIAPVSIGSGGSSGGGSGGGAARLTVAGTSLVNGVISASATNSGAAGSGGSVFLTTGALAGYGTIKACGITGSWQLGGGGRVAVILTNGNDFGELKIQAYPGSAIAGQGSYSSGGAGTVYLQTRDQGPGGGTLILDSSNRWCSSATLIHTNIAGTTVGTVIITNGAVLLLDSNLSLTVNGSWLNRSKPVTATTTNWTVSFTSAPNSTVVFAGTNAATIAGTNTFFNFDCTGGVRTVEFQAGASNIVNGRLALGGGATFKSTIDGSQCSLKLALGGTQQIGSVRVKDCNANDGQLLVAGKNSTDLGNNLNWLFIKSSGAMILVR